MIDPLNRADFILDNDPELAEALFDLVLFISECDDPPNNPQVDRVLEKCFARTEEGTRLRDNFAVKRRLQEARGVKRPARSRRQRSDSTIEAEIQV